MKNGTVTDHRADKFKAPSPSNGSAFSKSVRSDSSCASHALTSKTFYGNNDRSSAQPASTTYAVLYCKKGPKKRKAWSDGQLVATGQRVVLTDLTSHSQVASVRLDFAQAASLAPGAVIEVGQFEVDIKALEKSTSAKGTDSENGPATVEPAASPAPFSAPSAAAKGFRAPQLVRAPSTVGSKRPLGAVNRFLPLHASDAGPRSVKQTSAAGLSPPQPLQPPSVAPPSNSGSEGAAPSSAALTSCCGSAKPASASIATFRPLAVAHEAQGHPRKALSGSGFRVPEKSNSPKAIPPPRPRSTTPPPLQPPSFLPLPLRDKSQSQLQTQPQQPQAGVRRVVVAPREIADPVAVEGVTDPGLKALAKSLQPHQRAAVNFLWRAATNNPASHYSGEGSAASGGAILADAMGLGKTLSAIALVYCAVQHKLAAKAVVVVPSSLVENWRNEFCKWLRMFLSPHAAAADRKVLVAAAGQSGHKRPLKSKKKKKANSKQALGGFEDEDEEDDATAVVGGAEGVVQEFVAGRAPVLIISYEGFRKHAALLNGPTFRASSNGVGLLVCDEGHRLKAASGSLTMDALRQCPAPTKLLLTGTPVQNDLTELHSMVSFVAPQLLGPLGAFKKQVADPIAKGRDRGATSAQRASGREATTHLKRLLRPVLLRRTADALAKALPPRTDIVVFCRLSPQQQELYRELAAATPHGRNDLEEEEVDEEDEENENIQRNGRRNNHSSIASRTATTLAVTYADECEPATMATHSNSGAIFDPLVAIHAMRMVCNHPSLLPSNAAEVLRHGGDGVSSKSSGKTSGPSSGSAATAVGRTMNRLAAASGAGARAEEAPLLDVSASGKLQVLEALLLSIYNPKPSSHSAPTSSSSSSSSTVPSTERVVVVSNFTTTLDLIGQLAARHQWPTLRIDGQTPPDQRQGFVDRFNRHQDPTKLFLLSSHAGGVGLNLVGGSRLVLFDSDWNPAVDQQAMGRVWRQGQKKPCVMYRLLSTGTLEEKMYQRQVAKAELNCATHVSSAADTEAASSSNSSKTNSKSTTTSSSAMQSYDVRHFASGDLRDLFLCNFKVPLCDTLQVMRGRWGDGHNNPGGISSANSSISSSSGLPAALAVDSALRQAASALVTENKAPEVTAADETTAIADSNGSGGSLSLKLWNGAISYAHHVVEASGGEAGSDEDEESLVNDDAFPCETSQHRSAPSSGHTNDGFLGSDSEMEFDEGNSGGENDSSDDSAFDTTLKLPRSKRLRKKPASQKHAQAERNSCGSESDGCDSSSANSSSGEEAPKQRQTNSSTSPKFALQDSSSKDESDSGNP